MRAEAGARVYLYDTTLRDGAQTQGVDFGVADKIAIAEALDGLGIDYIEAGWPGANPTDDAVFETMPKLARSRIVSFGMTRRHGRSAANDPSLAAVVGARASAVCLVGKTWDFHVDVALGVARDENLAMIRDSVAHATRQGREVLFDAEHFFDGYAANPDYALGAIEAAHQAGARWIVLCDTNGGTLPDRVEAVVRAVAARIPGDHLGIHCHNDTENAVANSLAAVRAGARMVQGTINGLGERCGNANLVSLIPTLMLKMGMTTGIAPERLPRLAEVSRLLDRRLNRAPNRHAAYVGEAAFSHKAGLHASAVEKDPASYEHIRPELVGNRRHVVVSDQAGRANMAARLRDIGLEVDPQDKRLLRLLEDVKAKEYQGYAFDDVPASFELLARRAFDAVPRYFELDRFQIAVEHRHNAKGDLVTVSQATIKIDVAGEHLLIAAEGNGPVDALDAALRKALEPHYPALATMRLVDYKVRILTPQEGTKAVTRVMIESAGAMAGGEVRHWTTVGVSPNIMDASFNALEDGITWKLFHDGAKAA
ncbi:MAG: citramalate synthase [Alphaproteobacteria bacterium]|nr:citramalate synthase [Alphaproteobacteria bacterium]